MNPLDHHDLPAPALDPARRDAILAEILAEGAVRRTPKHRWLVPVGAAAAVSLVAVGGVALLDRDTEQPSASDGPSDVLSTRDPHREQRREQVEPFMVGPLTTVESDRVLAQCLPSFGYDPSTFEVALAQRVAGPWGREDVVVAADRVSGTQLFCGADEMSMMAGPDSKSVVRVPDAAHPLTPADVGGTSSSVGPSGDTRHLFTTAGFRVSDQVARVEMRVGTRSAPGIWRSSVPAGGFVYVGAWIEAAVPAGVELYVETRAYDVDGKPIDSDLLGRSAVEILPTHNYG